MNYVIKRDGRRRKFNEEKIKAAVLAAFNDVDGEISDYAVEKADNIAQYVSNYVSENNLKSISVEKIQDIVEQGLMSTKRKDVAKAIILYRKQRAEARENTIDKTVAELLDRNNEYWKTENSNKNADIVTVQRDYLAGVVSTDISRRKLLPKSVCEAHDEGIIHEHDMDYLAQSALSNCCLINLEDMLQNGTIINGVKIDPQHRLSTASTVTTQIITAVASSQYGGTTISLAHLAPFVRMSYNSYIDKYKDWGFSSEDCIKYASIDLKKEIRDSVQTFNYQINSMSTTNGQAPFLSVNMYLGETTEYKKELALLIEEFLNQRILGMKNSKGIYVTPAFPKLLYVLEEDNINKDSPYYYLTELAAKCTAKRMVPDYISEKIMKQLKLNPITKVGEAYPCMGM